jgi:hypothetical protein
MSRLEELLEYEIAGDPMTGLRWTRKTTQKLANWLSANGQQVSANTVARLLRKMNFALRTNRKCIESGGRKKVKPKDRDRQFKYINRMRRRFAQRGLPVISIDAKKRELVGPFLNRGRTWSRETRDVYDHDFPSDARGVGIPHSIFDTQRNRGSVCIGTSHETPALAVDHLTRWWRSEGQKAYPKANELLILADCGGSNAARSRVFKWRLHQQLCVECQIKVTLCHFPPGASKWNPIEHRMFSHIQGNWAGRPLDSYEVMLKYCRNTRTSKGLKVTAHLARKVYENGERVPDKKLRMLPIERAKTFPNWNYSILPSPLKQEKM